MAKKVIITNCKGRVCANLTGHAKHKWNFCIDSELSKRTNNCIKCCVNCTESCEARCGVEVKSI